MSNAEAECVNAPMLIYVAREAGAVKIRKYLAAIAMPLLSAAVMAVTVWGAGSVLHASWPNLIACVGFGALLYCTLLHALDQHTARWLWTFSCEAAQLRTSTRPVATVPLSITA